VSDVVIGPNLWNGFKAAEGPPAAHYGTHFGSAKTHYDIGHYEPTPLPDGLDASDSLWGYTPSLPLGAKR